jgi:hypothetical protein
MELELKHLAPYLPYGLKIRNGNNNYTLVANANLYETDGFVSIGSIREGIDKPILRPLPDLIKVIQHNKEEFIPSIEYHYIKDELEELSSLDCSYIRYARYNVVSILFELHFDVFGLIEKGLAIDINSLKITL